MADRHKKIEPVAADAVRRATVAGKFYPDHPLLLRQHVQEMLAQAAVKPASAQLLAAIAPHAGYRYSGNVAAHTYERLRHQHVDTVIFIAPSHWERFPFISIFTGQSFRTPLGDLPVATTIAEQLLHKHDYFMSAWHGHHTEESRGEHAIEVQLPFLQVALPDCAIVPIVMGEQSWELCEVLGLALAEMAAKTPFVMVASSDLSHYHEYHEARRIDAYFMQLLQTLDPPRVFEALHSRVCEACGAGPIVSAMIAARELGADDAEILCYQNSGDTGGDYEAVVGYVSATLERMNGTGNS